MSKEHVPESKGNNEDGNHQDGQPQEEGLIIPAKVATTSPDFMKALHMFQYGTAEESDEGFRRMAEIGSSSQETERDGKKTR